MKLRKPVRAKAFTLVELSLVLLVLSLLAAAALRYATVREDTTNTNTLNATLDVIDAALLNYRAAYGRLPCPADITAAENTTNFGAEVDTNGVGSGNCGGANFKSGVLAMGSIPTKTLRLADKYAYDSWGRKIEYGVDNRMTATNAFTLYPIYYHPTANSSSTNLNAFTVKDSNGHILAGGYDNFPVYILLSFGKNGHGGFIRNISTTCTLTTCPIFYGESTNTDELQNCKCNVTATATSFTTVFVQDTPNNTNGGLYNVIFDDVVRFKTRAQMATTKELQ